MLFFFDFYQLYISLLTRITRRRGGGRGRETGIEGCQRRGPPFVQTSDREGRGGGVAGRKEGGGNESDLKGEFEIEINPKRINQKERPYAKSDAFSFSGRTP